LGAAAALEEAVEGSDDAPGGVWGRRRPLWRRRRLWARWEARRGGGGEGVAGVGCGGGGHDDGGRAGAAAGTGEHDDGDGRVTADGRARRGRAGAAVVVAGV
jgi:hypothetical protein